MKLTKENLIQFLEEWQIAQDESPMMLHPEDLIHGLEIQFDLIPRKKISKTLMQVFAEEDMKNQPEIDMDDCPF